MITCQDYWETSADVSMWYLKAAFQSLVMLHVGSDPVVDPGRDISSSVC